jgi:ATP synthase F1 gamma subunit
VSKILRLEKEYAQIGTIQGLTSLFETIASIRLAKIKDKVISSTLFFDELWHIYTQLRIDQKESIGRHPTAPPGSFALIAVTSDGGLIGDIDQKIIKTLLGDERIATADIFVIGLHGINLLHEGDVAAKQGFALPDVEKAANISPIAQVIAKYEKATLYYQQYISLSHQEVGKIDLFSAVAVLGKDQEDPTMELISSRDYLLEPSQGDIVTYMESVMLEIALGQVILESRLAQYASRFNAMNGAKIKAKQLQREAGMALHRLKRSINDERTKEVLNVMKLLRKG